MRAVVSDMAEIVKSSAITNTVRTAIGNSGFDLSALYPIAVTPAPTHQKATTWAMFSGTKQDIINGTANMKAEMM